jgi:hypothetical protein
MRMNLANGSWETQERLLNLQPFKGSNFYAGPPPYALNTGRLPATWRERYREDVETCGVVYAVMSYATPIAWVCADGTVVIPDVKYSVSTTRHQSYLHALRPNLSDEARVRVLDNATRERMTRSGRVVHAPEPLAPRAAAKRPTEYLAVRLEYSDSYSLRQGWATSYVDGPASQVGGYATYGTNEER